MRLLILNGPNLNLLGRREQDIYGRHSFESYFHWLRNAYPDITLQHYQSNVEGELIDRLHAAMHDDGIIFNAGGYTHTSVAIADAVAAMEPPVVEVHISNIMAREPFRRKSLLTPYCRGIISGFGLEVYRLAVESFLPLWPEKK